MKTAIELAREAGFEVSGEHLTWESVICTEEVERLVALARADEREACCSAETLNAANIYGSDLPHQVVAKYEAAIRARGNT
jgi:hypothetical protein